MKKYHMDVLLRAKQGQQEVKVRSAKRQLENADDQVPEASKNQPTEVTKTQ
ncbi:hypothetical protein PF010_g13612 [Phytophthora fragariae]|uniref:Uncharacterized protein n=1 Tax=Phytophthora fragariae TaxID=53985 RepID=A0A6A3FGE7_9STRA|nr:hypothetical protein PF003_g36252 [Phytophthora fragariae]KAE8944885.1 hypothetical protein PF009_g5447 [Phytophthora fragariae]KAE9023132.1 hypothetical protein PF011_g4137 [Phytophthora fragariae]KAE9103793.1 hypothetical protein PF010_g13612 [Phytophthora fragariae]KAE9128829.1 hypothetical protein PF007_g5126 [Phytophthora fragariae]